MVLENGLIAAIVAPSNGGRITSLRLLEADCDFTYAAPRPSDLLTFLGRETVVGGLLQDHFMQPADCLWTGEESAGEYKITVRESIVTKPA